MAIDIATIDERLAKAKEEAEFWEKARAVLADPRLQAISGEKAPTVQRGLSATQSQTIQTAIAGPRAYGELQANVYGVLPEADAGVNHRLTTQQIVERLQNKGYKFVAKEPAIAVNGALITLEAKGLVDWSAKRGNAKLWRKKRQRVETVQESQEPAEAGS
jgi:hypothetical protein